MSRRRADPVLLPGYVATVPTLSVLRGRSRGKSCPLLVRAVRGHLAARVCQVSDYVQVSTAAPSRDVAVELAQQAVGRRLAAGAQIVGPVTSVFWHLGEQGVGEEWQVLLYTTQARYPDLEECLHQAHPWTNPQVTAVPVMAGATGYLNWVARTVDDA